MWREKMMWRCVKRTFASNLYPKVLSLATGERERSLRTRLLCEQFFFRRSSRRSAGQESWARNGMAEREMKRGLLPSFSSAVQWLFSRSRWRYYPHSPLLKIVTHSKIYKEMYGITHTCQDVYLDEFLGKYWRVLVYCSPDKRQTRGFCKLVVLFMAQWGFCW